MPAFSSFLQKTRLISQAPIFSKLNWFQLQNVVLRSTVIECKKGETLIRQGEPPDAFYCLVSGRLQSFIPDSAGQKSQVEFIRRGAHLGVTALMTDEEHTRTYMAINDSLLIRISKDDFKQILTAVPHLALELTERLSERIRHRDRERKPGLDGQIISVYSPVKGGGSSTYAAHLAMSLARETGKRVLLVHFSTPQDRQGVGSGPDDGPSAHWLPGGVNLREVVGDDDKVREGICRGMMPADLLAVDFDPGSQDLVDQISRFVTGLVMDYSYVVVDLPNEMDDMVFKTLTQSDLVQLVAVNRSGDLKLTRQVIYRLEEELKEHFTVDKVRVIIREEQEELFPFEDINRQIDYDIYGKLPQIRSHELGAAVETSLLVLRDLAEDCAYRKVLRKISRQISNVLVGLVLGGGAALGIAHIGVLKVLEEENVPVDLIVGSSMGALIGSLWVTGHRANDIERIAAQFKTKRGVLKLIDPILPVSGVIGGRAIQRWLKRLLGNKIFYDTEVPFKVVAYDIIKNHEIVINSGPIVDAVMRSIAIPGVIKPVRDHERVIIDGGVLNPLPTDVLKKMGVEKIIAVNVLQSPQDVTLSYEQEQAEFRREKVIPFHRRPWTYLFSRMKGAFNRFFMPNISDIVIRSLQASEYLIAEKSSQLADVTIHPDLVGLSWYQFNQVDELIKRGEDAARAQLAEIKQLVKS